MGLIFDPCMQERNLYIIAGCNGAGKTTASETVLPDLLHCREFVNADNIARGLSPFNVEKVAFEAGRIMLHRVNELLVQGKDFAIETTLSTRSYLGLVRRAQHLNYRVTLLFVWLDHPDLAKARVAGRVAKGGHNIPSEVIERRYRKGLCNLFLRFMAEVDFWILVDNSHGALQQVAAGEKNLEADIQNPYLWRSIQDSLHGYCQ